LSQFPILLTTKFEPFLPTCHLLRIHQKEHKLDLTSVPVGKVARKVVVSGEVPDVRFQILKDKQTAQTVKNTQILAAAHTPTKADKVKTATTPAKIHKIKPATMLATATIITTKAENKVS
jgi:hypothetical protein